MIHRQKEVNHNIYNPKFGNYKSRQHTVVKQRIMSLLDALADAAALRIQEEGAIIDETIKPSPANNKQGMTLTDFSHDILHHVYAFIPTIDNLRNCIILNKRASEWILESKTSEPLFGTAYKLAFGEPAPLTGRKAWKELLYIRQALSRGMYHITSPSEVHTVGILPLEKETEAIGYDHSHFEEGQCLGYFAMTRIFPHGEGPLAISGDFDGIYIVTSIEDLLSSSSTKPFSKINGDSQALTVLATPLAYNADTKSTTFFVGYASGKVQAVRAVQQGEGFSFEVVSTAAAHTDEVTALSVLPTNPPCVASSSVDETIMAYPNSLSENPTLDNAALAYRSNDPPAKILFFAGMGDMVCCGDDSGRLTLLSVEPESEPLLQKVASEFLGEPGTLPTLVKFHHNKTIVVGTNKGELHTFEVVFLEDTCSLVRKNYTFIHAGAIESVNVVGNIVLTCSAHEGHLRGCDIRTLEDLGSIAVHPGRLCQPREPGQSQLLLKCAVMSVIIRHEHQSFVSLCRDGTVQEYSFAPAKGIEQAATSLNKLQDVAAPMLGSSITETGKSIPARVRMSIIQASLENRKDPALPFVGADGVTYGTTQSSFDRFSGVFPCRACQSSCEGVR